MAEQGPSKGARGGITSRVVELTVAALTLAFGAVVAYQSYRLGARWASDGPQAGYFPFYIGLIICVASLMNFGRVFFSTIPGARVHVFVEREALKRIFAILIPAIVYVIGIYLVGIYVSSLFYIAVFMIWMGQYPWYKGVAVGSGVSVFLYLMFDVWFQVLLPRGAYDVLGMIGL
jgi:hypothetical protein